MTVITVKEIKNNENRVGITPGGAAALCARGHRVLVQTRAGEGSGYADDLYREAGAEILEDIEELFARAQLIVKVKEPLPSEYGLYREGQALFTYLHLAPNPGLAGALLERRVTGIAYETVTLPDGSLPLLTPMSEVAGRMAVQIGATLLQKTNGGAGLLLGGVPGVEPAEVVIVGGGVAGTNAARIALGFGASVTVLDINTERLRTLDDLFGGRIRTRVSGAYNLAEAVKKADLLIGAVLVAGASAPKIVSEAMVKTMKKGSVIVDVAIDQGGSVETIDRATTYDSPSYEKHGVIHSAIANIPGAVPRTSTLALEAATLPYTLQLADSGIAGALTENPALRHGLCTARGRMTCPRAARSLGLEYSDPAALLSQL